MARATKTLEPRTLKIRSGDHVKVISGKDRGKTGRVLRVDPKRERVFVEHLNMIKRHTRPSQVAGAQSEAALGGVIESRPLSRTKRWALVDVLERAR